MLESRQKEILEVLVRSYVETAEPVASADLAREFNLSSATIRNEMAELEKNGYIYQPHVSAGRVPTELGFRFYVSEFLKPNEPGPRIKQELKGCLKKNDFEGSVKSLSRKLADFSEEAVVVAFGRDDIFYTGISNIFSKPEFQDLNLVMNFSRIVDHLDEVVGGIFDQPDQGVQILLGQENPFGRELGSLITRCHFGDQQGLITLIGPIRMYYENNLGLLNFFRDLIEGQN